MKSRIESARRLFCLVCAGLFVLVITTFAPCMAQAQSQGDGSRQIVAEEFTKNRIKPPSTSATSGGAGISKRPSGGSSITNRVRPRYRRVAAPVKKGSSASTDSTSSTAAAAANEIPADAPKVGVTIWRLRPTRPADTGARLLIQEDAKETQWTPERVGVDKELSVGDRVRLSIESSRVGYLYVVDRELYADGTMGDPYLIFPTTRTRGGDNKVQPGKLIDIPAQEDKPNYFTLTPGRDDQVAEVLSVIVTTEPLEGFEMTDKPVKLSKAQVEKWEKEWAARVEQYEMEGGSGQTWSKEEKESAVGTTGRLLTQGDPSPQIIYLVEGKNNKGLLVTVPLRYRR